MLKKSHEVHDGSLNTDQSLPKGKRSNSQNTDNSKHSSSNSSGSSRSKYLSGHMLTRSTLYDSIRGKKPGFKESLEQKCLEVELLRDTLSIAQRREQELLAAMKGDFRNYREEGRKLMRVLEHLTQWNLKVSWACPFPSRFNGLYYINFSSNV